MSYGQVLAWTEILMPTNRVIHELYWTHDQYVMSHNAIWGRSAPKQRPPINHMIWPFFVGRSVALFEHALVNSEERSDTSDTLT